MNAPLLAVSDLAVGFPSDAGLVQAVRGVSFEVRRGESLGIVGESGSGKSTIAQAVLGLLPKGTKLSGSVRAEGKELLGLSEGDLGEVRGRLIAYIPQDPLSSLNPAFRVGWQIAEAVWTHQQVSHDDAMKRAVQLLEMVGIPEAKARAKSYPHEFSGGMRQRVVIAMAMANDPDLIIADEPTTALDVTIQAQVLEALKAARDETNSSLVLITHDLGVVAGMSDQVMVMYAGRAVETSQSDDIFYRSRMPYTLGLLGSLPRLDIDPRGALRPIPGTPPSLVTLPRGCPFSPRCAAAIDQCRKAEPDLLPVGDGHAAACIRSGELEPGRTDLFQATWADTTEGPAAVATGPTAAGPEANGAPAGEVLIEVKDLVKNFPIYGGGLIRRRVGEAQAVSGVNFELRERETLSLVGESGCGKSTTARSVLQLVSTTSGSVRFQGQELTGRSRSKLRPIRQGIQIVFQDPFASLDPLMPVGELIAEPLHVHGRWGRDGSARVAELLQMVGLNPEHRNRYPHEFSGGQRQRIGVARALALQPKVLVLDEPVSALDVSIQAGVVNMLEELQQRLGLGYLFIAHDLSVVRHISHRVAVMYLGKIVELGTRQDVYERPSHPYTQALLSAVPIPNPDLERQRRRIILKGDVPSATRPPSGCRFRTRCWKAQEICTREEPALIDRGQGHPSACHFAEVNPVLTAALQSSGNGFRQPSPSSSPPAPQPGA